MTEQAKNRPVFIKREMEPISIEVAGNMYPAIFNYRAITAFEDKNDGLLMELVVGVLDSVYDEYGKVKKDDNGDPLPSLPTRVVLSVLACMMQAAGVEVEEEELFSSVCFGELPMIIAQLKGVISQQRFQNEKGERNQKNAKSTTMKK